MLEIGFTTEYEEGGEVGGAEGAREEQEEWQEKNQANQNSNSNGPIVICKVSICIFLFDFLD